MDTRPKWGSPKFIEYVNLIVSTKSDGQELSLQCSYWVFKEKHEESYLTHIFLFFWHNSFILSR